MKCSKCHKASISLEWIQSTQKQQSPWQKVPICFVLQIKISKAAEFLYKKRGTVFLATVYKACERGLQNP